MTGTNPFMENRWEICWQVINAGIAAGLVILGAITVGKIDMQTIGAACVAGLIVFFTQLRTYWQTQQSEYGKKGNISLLTFI